ncbi:MAG: CHAT domain-containing protein, partial [Thermodesulfobacteriota bacterium]|nr:CHAT domain-containing protein [Thermodesulfobacteriota bacterium]
GLLTKSCKDKISRTTAEDMILNIDDQLVHIPWELLYDGTQFFCQRFSMGRLVVTMQATGGLKLRELKKPLNFMILADPRNNLTASHKEGLAIRDALEKKEELIKIDFKSSDVKVDFVKSNIRHYDLVHYAGHADYNLANPSESGWLLSDRKLTAADIRNLAGVTALPYLIFSNACQSGHTEEWKLNEAYGEEIYGLANAFLLSGVQHYIGTFWEVQDEPSYIFAKEFYQNIFDGDSVGKAIKKGRKKLLEKYGEESILWATYMLYGDPTFKYIEIEEEKVEEHMQEPMEQKVAGVLRAGAEMGVKAPLEKKKKFFNQPLVLGALVFIILSVISGGFFLTHRKGKTEDLAILEKAYVFYKAREYAKAKEIFNRMLEDKQGGYGYEGLAAIHFDQGDYKKALTMADNAIKINPDAVYSRVIKGNILFQKGDTPLASSMFKEALSLDGGLGWQKASASNRLGRIYAEQGNYDKALEFYTKAVKYDPGNAQAFSNKGALLKKQGRPEEALLAYKKASELDPKDYVSKLMLKKTLEEQKLKKDKKRQERIDKLVSDLIENFDKQKDISTKYPKDEWSSKPLTISILDVKRKGAAALREGEDEFITLKISENFMENPRIKVVERAILDKLLEELKLASSQLADKKTAIKVGKILGARLILTGMLINSGKESLLNLRTIETETTSIKATAQEDFKEETLEEAIDKATKNLEEKIIKTYPIRGKIAQIEDDQVILNIGGKHGVPVGLNLKVIDEFPVKMDGEIIGYKKAEVGEIEVTSVEDTLSYAKILSSTKDLISGQKVLE